MLRFIAAFILVLFCLPLYRLPGAVAVGQSAVSGNFQGDANHDGQSGAQLGSALVPLWTAHSGNGFSYPVIGGGRVFNRDDGVIEARSALTGAVLWRVPIGLRPGGLALDGGTLFATTSQDVEAVDAASGSLLWDRRLTDEIAGVASVPTVANGVLYVTARRQYSGAVVALAEATGSTLWMSQAGFTGPSVLAGSIVSAGVGDSSCAATEAITTATGSYLWDTADGGCHGVGNQPATPLHGGQAYATVGAAGQSSVHVLALADGSLTRTSSDPDPLPSFAGDTEFSVNAGQVVSNSTADGTSGWQSAGSDYTSPTLSTGTAVFAVATDGRVDELDAATGLVLWSSAPDPSTTPPTYPGEPVPVSTSGMAAVDGLLVVPSSGSLRAFADPLAVPQPAVLPPAPLPEPQLAAPDSTTASAWTAFGGNSRHDFDDAGDATVGAYTPAWSVDYGTKQISQPLITPDGVFVATDTDLYGYSLVTGDPLWPPVPITGPDGGAPELTADDGIIEGGGDANGRVVAVSAIAGNVLFTGDFAPANQLTTAMGRIFVGSSQFDLHTGTSLATTGIEANQSFPDSVDPATDSYFQTSCATVTKFDIATNAERWSAPGDCDIGGFDTAALDGGIVSMSGLTYDATTGVPTAPVPGTVAASGNLLVLEGAAGVSGVDAVTRRELWTYAEPTYLTSPPIIDGSQVLLFLGNGTLVHLDAETGAVTGTDPVPVAVGQDFYIFSSPAVAQHLIVIPTATGISVLRAAGAIVTVPTLPVTAPTTAPTVSPIAVPSLPVSLPSPATPISVTSHAASSPLRLPSASTVLRATPTAYQATATPAVSPATTAPLQPASPASLTQGIRLPQRLWVRAVPGRRQRFSLQIKSTGTGPLAISRTNLTGRGTRWWTVVHSCPTVVQHGHACTVTLSLRPGSTAPPPTTLLLRTGAGLRSVLLAADIVPAHHNREL